MLGKFFMVLVLLFSLESTAMQLDIKFQDVTYGNMNYKKLNGFMASPKEKGSYPALILIHEWWGLNDDIKAKAKKFAKLGYVTLAIDLYGGKSSTNRADAKVYASTVRQNQSKAFENIKKALKFIKNKNNVIKERVGSIGWCFGGGWSYQIAKNNLGVKSSVIYYGRFNPKDDLQKMRADIIGHFAQTDRSISIDNVKEFQVKLKTLKGNHEVYIYPNTSHGFASREGSNKKYMKDAADLAWDRTISFLKSNL